MREIKFRAWDGERMQSGALGAISRPASNESGISFPEYYSPYSLNCNMLALMQFTGLLDKNGQEIYEGDILADESNFPGVIVWHKETASFVVDFKDDLQDIVDIGKWASIIGNIYEPELLS